MNIVDKIFNIRKLKQNGIWFSGIEGEYKEWYSNGQLWKHCFYKDGEPHGEYKSWDSYNKLQIHGFYVDGEKHGHFKEYDFGRLYKHSIYNMGVIDEIVI